MIFSHRTFHKLNFALVKEEKFPKINNNKLLFIDDQVGIVQEMKQHNDRCKEVKKGKITLRNFKILGQLGVGGFSTVYKVQHILTDKIYAMKVMNKNYIIKKKYLHYVVSEFEIMKSLAGFPFVLELHYCFQSANYLYLIVDYCPNGDFANLKSLNNISGIFSSEEDLYLSSSSLLTISRIFLVHRLTFGVFCLLMTVV